MNQDESKNNPKSSQPVEKKTKDTLLSNNEHYKINEIFSDTIKDKGISEKYISATPSIKNLINEKSVPEQKQNITSTGDVENEDKPTEIRENKFTTDQLLKSYHHFVETIKSNKPRLYSTLNSQQPQLSGLHTVEITLSNQAIQNDFEKNLSHDMTHFLRNELQNDNIIIEVIVSKLKEQNKLYTSEEKFKHLVSKNPALNELKKKLDLDFE